MKKPLHVKFTYIHPGDVVTHPAREPSPCPPLVGHCVRL